MRETEITVQVFDEVDEIHAKLKTLGFTLEHHTVMTDWYFSKELNEKLVKMSYEEIIRNSFIVRELNIDGKVKTLLHYKDKEFDENGNVISEEKLKEPLENAENAVKIFTMAGLNNWIKVMQDMYIYGKSDMHFALQIVDGLGTYIEYEEDESVAGLSSEEKVVGLFNRLKALGFNFGQDTNVKKVYEIFLKEQSYKEEQSDF